MDSNTLKDSLDEEISEIFLDQQTKAAVLLLLVLTDGSFNLDHLTDPDTDTAKHLDKLYKILKLLPSRDTLPKELRKTAMSLIRTYVLCDINIVTFRDPKVSDAVAYAVGNISKSFILSHFSLKFVVERIVYKTDIAVTVDVNFRKLIVIGESYIDLLIQRLITEMQNGRIALSMSHQALLLEGVFEKLVKKLNARSSSVIGDVIHEKDVDENGLSFLFWASYTGVWKTGFLNVLGKHQFSSEEYLQAYLGACISNNIEAFQELQDHGGSLDGQITFTTLSVIAPRAERKVLMRNQEEKATHVVSRRHDRNMDHLIHIAAANGHLHIVRLLLDMSIDINDTGGMCMTPLMYGSFFGHHDLVQMLLRNGADTERKNSDNENCLHLAVRGRYANVIKLLLENGRMDPDCRGRYDRTPLMYASYDGHMDIVMLLIEHRACLQPEPTKINKNNSLHEACVTGKQDIVELLTGLMDIEAAGEKERTPLHAACRGGRLKTVKYLVSKQANIEMLDGNGCNCLHLASMSGDVDTVKWLLEETPFRLESTNNLNQTPLVCSVIGNQLTMFTFLLDRGATFKVQDQKGGTCMHYAAMNGNLELVEILQSKGFEIDERGYKKRTPVMQSCQFGHEDVFIFLKQHGADLTIEDENKATCLHFACIGKNVAIVQYLLDLNIFDVNTSDRQKNTPLQNALRTDSSELVDLLVRYGAMMN